MYRASRLATFIAWAGLLSSVASGADAQWPTLGGDTRRQGVSNYTGPKLGSLAWARGALGAVYRGVTVGSEGQVYSVTANGVLTAMDADGEVLWDYVLGKGRIFQTDRIDGWYSSWDPNATGSWDALMAWTRIPHAGYVGSLLDLGSVSLEIIERNAVPVLACRSWSSGSVYGTTPVNAQAGTEVGVVIPQEAKHWCDVQLYIDGLPEECMETRADYTVPKDGMGSGIIFPNGQVKFFRGAEDVVSHPTLGLDGTVYVGFGNVLYALRSDSVFRWKYETGGFVNSCPAVDEAGRVFFGSADGFVYALRPDGSQLWRFDVPAPGVITGGVLQSPTIGKDGSVYVGGLYQGTLYALDPAEGGVRWQSQLTAAEDSAGGFVAAPVVGPDGTVYIRMYDDPHLYAIDPNDGDLLWATDLSHEPELVGYWKFDEGTGDIAYDSSVYGRKLKLSNSYYQAKWVAGVLDGALARASRTVEHFGWDEGTIGRTMCFWVRVPYGGTGNIAGWGGGDDVTLSVHDGRIRAAINGGHLVANTPLRINEWQHVAVVVADGGPTTGMDDVCIYLDGCLDADAVRNRGFAPNTKPLQISSSSTSTIDIYANSYLYLDDLRLYETALSAGQIQELMWDETAPTFSALRPATSGIARGRCSWGEVAVSSDGTIYAGLDDPYLRAINLDGTVRWVKHLACGGNYTLTVGADGLVYAAGADGVLYVIRPDGKLLSRFDAAAAARYVGLREDSGRLIEDVCALSYPVVAADGRIYVSDEAGRIWAVSRREDGPPYALTCQNLFGDVNDDCVVNLVDFALVAADWLGCTDSPWCDDGLNNPWHYVPGYWSSDPMRNKYLAGDVDQNGYVGLSDVAFIIRTWLNGADLYD